MKVLSDEFADKTVCEVCGDQLNSVLSLFVNCFNIPMDICTRWVQFALTKFIMWFPSASRKRIEPHYGMFERNGGQCHVEFIPRPNPDSDKYMNMLFDQLFPNCDYTLDEYDKMILLNTDTIIMIGVVLYDMYIQMTNKSSSIIAVEDFGCFYKNQNMYNLFINTLCRYLANLYIVWDVPCWTSSMMIPDEDEKFVFYRFLRSPADRAGFDDYNLPKDIFPVIFPDFSLPRLQP